MEDKRKKLVEQLIALIGPIRSLESTVEEYKRTSGFYELQEEKSEFDKVLEDIDSTEKRIDEEEQCIASFIEKFKGFTKKAWFKILVDFYNKTLNIITVEAIPKTDKKFRKFNRAGFRELRSALKQALKDPDLSKIPSEILVNIRQAFANVLTIEGNSHFLAINGEAKKDSIEPAVSKIHNLIARFLTDGMQDTSVTINEYHDGTISPRNRANFIYSLINASVLSEEAHSIIPVSEEIEEARAYLSTQKSFYTKMKKVNEGRTAKILEGEQEVSEPIRILTERVTPQAIKLLSSIEGVDNKHLTIEDISLLIGASTDTMVRVAESLHDKLRETKTLDEQSVK